MTFKCHRYPTYGNYIMCTYATSISVYIPHINSKQPTISQKQSKTSNPVGIVLSSNMHMYYTFGSHIYPHMYSFFADISCFLYLCLKLRTLCTHVYNAHEFISRHSQIFFICKQYLFFHIYVPFGFPCLVVIFVFCKCL